jgi:two-component system NtrC family response regulator
MENELPVQSPIASLDDIEKDHILKAIKFFEGNKTKVAEALGVTKKTLYNKIYKWGLEQELIRPPAKIF